MSEKHADKTTAFTFRIPTDLKADLAKIAEREDRSLSRQVISVLKNFVAADQRKEKKR